MTSKKTGYLIVDGSLTGLITEKVTIKIVHWDDGDRVALFIHYKEAADAVSHWLNLQKIEYRVMLNFYQKYQENEGGFDLYNLFTPKVETRELFDKLAKKIYEERPQSQFWMALD